MPEQNQRRDKDAPLRQDVRTLGNALGQAIQRHGGHSVFETVEHLRRNCKRLRNCTERLSQASPAESEQLQSEITALSQEIRKRSGGE
jgi:phosphoenolpyruvate carboxylase